MHAYAQLVTIPQMWHSHARAPALQCVTHSQGHASVLSVLYVLMLAILDSCLQKQLKQLGD